MKNNLMRVLSNLTRPLYFLKRALRNLKCAIRNFGCGVFLVGALYFAAISLTVYLYSTYTDDAPTRQVDTPPEKVKRTEEKQDNIRLKEYELHINLFQFYLSLALTAITFFYALTGGILAYSLTNYKESPRVSIPLFGKKFPIVKLSLLVPILLSAIFGCVFIFGSKKWNSLVERIGGFRDNLGIEKVPDVLMLSQLLLIFGITFFCVGIVLFLFLLIDLEESPLALANRDTN